MISSIKSINLLISKVLFLTVFLCNSNVDAVSVTNSRSYDEKFRVCKKPILINIFATTIKKLETHHNFNGGYKIQPKSCVSSLLKNDGPTGTCMFNSECKQRNGNILGVCLDGFLFGVCCHIENDKDLLKFRVSTEFPLNNKRSTTKFFLNLLNKRPNGTTVVSANEDKYVLVPTIKPPVTITNDNGNGNGNNKNPISSTISNNLESFTRIPTVGSEASASMHYVFSVKPTQKPIYADSSNEDYPITIRTSTVDNYQLIYSSTKNKYVHKVTKKPQETQTASATAQLTVVTTPSPDRFESDDVIGPAYQVAGNSQIPTIILLSSKKPVKVSPTPKPNGGETVFITPKPTSIQSSVQFVTAASENPNLPLEELNNFPPVRNPNLNLTLQISNVVSDDQIQLPNLVEDEKFKKKINNFVKNIVQNLNKPFNDLRVVVLDKKNSSSQPGFTSGIKRPAIDVTTKKPVVTRKTTTTTYSPAIVTTNQPPLSPVSSAASPPKKSKPTKKTTFLTTTTSATVTQPSKHTYDYRKTCGVRPLMKRDGRIVGGKGSEFGEWPWIVLIRESTWLGLFTRNKCGGVLITTKYVLTAAHCQPGFLAFLIAVFGEYDISGDLEPRKSIIRKVQQVIVHRKYVATTFENDIALLKLEKDVNYDEHIVPICLPDDSDDFTSRMATVAGWGRLRYQGGVPAILQEVQVPIMENNVCQELFLAGGHQKKIHDSFMCAGYANGQKDSCEGDSGGPLMLQRPDGLWKLAGTVSHGIMCAAPYLPGIYMRTTFYKNWILAIVGENQTDVRRHHRV